jgi:hypothetical protein
MTVNYAHMRIEQYAKSSREQLPDNGWQWGQQCVIQQGSEVGIMAGLLEG